jgi:hypothetical protein
MTFVIRQVSLIFEDKGKQLPPLEIKGLKCNVVAKSVIGLSHFHECQVRVWGMTLEQMLQFSNDRQSSVAIQNKVLTVLAGDQGKSLTQMFKGTIRSSYIDTSSLPDVGFACEAISAYYEKANPIPPNSYKGAVKAEGVIASLTKTLGNDWAFVNNGASAVVENPYVLGSAVEQIQSIAAQARFGIKFENNTVTIWPNDKNSSNNVVEVGPTTGMVGYPSFWAVGLNVKTEFKPLITTGGIVRLTSDLPNAKGDFICIEATHELSTVTANGPWFTTMKLSPIGSLSVPKN